MEMLQTKREMLLLFISIDHLSKNLSNCLAQLAGTGLSFNNTSPVVTSHSAYDATLTESDGVKIDGFLYSNFM